MVNCLIDHDIREAMKRMRERAMAEHEHDVSCGCGTPVGGNVAQLLIALAPLHELRAVNLEIRFNEKRAAWTVWAVKMTGTRVVYVGFVRKDYKTKQQYVQDMDAARSVYEEICQKQTARRMGEPVKLQLVK